MSADAGDAGTGPATGQGSPAGTAGVGSTDDADGTTGQLEGQGEGAQSDEDLAAQVVHWKEMAKKNERRAKENSAAAARLKTIDQANMTELEKAQAAQREAEAARDEALATHARVMAAAAHNLPVELIDILGTGTDDEINERAELLQTSIEEMAQEIAEQLIADKVASGELVVGQGANRNGAAPQQQLAARPVESLRPGSAPAGATPNTPEQWFRQLLHGS